MPEQIEEQKFNLRTHHWDARGRLKKRDNYRLHVKDGVQYFERPVNSGNLFYENNEPAGRVEYVPDEKGRKFKKFDFEAEHKSYVAPLTGTEKLHFENQNLKDENAKLLAELEAIKQEQAAKDAAKNQKVTQQAQSNLAKAVEKPQAQAKQAAPAEKDNEL